MRWSRTLRGCGGLTLEWTATEGGRCPRGTPVIGTRDYHIASRGPARKRGKDARSGRLAPHNIQHSSTDLALLQGGKIRPQTCFPSLAEAEDREQTGLVFFIDFASEPACHRPSRPSGSLADRSPVTPFPTLHPLPPRLQLDAGDVPTDPHRLPTSPRPCPLFSPRQRPPTPTLFPTKPL